MTASPLLATFNTSGTTSSIRRAMRKVSVGAARRIASARASTVTPAIGSSLAG
jgi:hypothetical protein